MFSFPDNSNFRISLSYYTFYVCYTILCYIIYIKKRYYIITLLVQFLVKSSNPDLARDNFASPPQPRCNIQIVKWILKILSFTDKHLITNYISRFPQLVSSSLLMGKYHSQNIYIVTVTTRYEIKFVLFQISNFVKKTYEKMQILTVQVLQQPCVSIRRSWAPYAGHQRGLDRRSQFGSL